MIETPAVCDSCIHRINKTACEAFDRIPESILEYGETHDAPISDQQNGIVWEFAPGTDSALEDWRKYMELTTG